MSGRDSSISLNCSLTIPTTTMSTTIQDGGHTPNTPEILNSIVNMTAGPFADYNQTNTTTAQFIATSVPSYTASVSPMTSIPSLASSSSHLESYHSSPMDPSHHSSPMDPSYHSLHAASPAYSDTSDSSSSSLTSPLSPPSATPFASPSSGMSVQHYRSQFIKEGLKMKVQQKLKTDFGGPMDTLLVPKIKLEDEDSLTLEDEERRRRRRERNKVAATKCRNKKKERTGLLIKESEVLEVHNSSLKIEISRLEAEKRHLMDILALHEPTCTKRPRKDKSHASQQPQAGSRHDQNQQSGLFRVPAPPQQTQRRQPSATTVSRPDNSQVWQHGKQLTSTTGRRQDNVQVWEHDKQLLPSNSLAEVVDSLTCITESQVDIAENLTTGQENRDDVSDSHDKNILDSFTDFVDSQAGAAMDGEENISYFQHSAGDREKGEQTDKGLYNSWDREKGEGTEKGLYKSCSFTRNSQSNHFLGKTLSLSQHGLIGQLDNRCLAL